MTTLTTPKFRIVRLSLMHGKNNFTSNSRQLSIKSSFAVALLFSHYFNKTKKQNLKRFYSRIYVDFNHFRFRMFISRCKHYYAHLQIPFFYDTSSRFMNLNFFRAQIEEIFLAPNKSREKKFNGRERGLNQVLFLCCRAPCKSKKAFYEMVRFRKPQFQSLFLSFSSMEKC